MITSIGQPQQNLSNSEMETAPDHMIIVSTQGNHDNEEFGVVIWAGFIGVKEDTVEMHAAIPAQGNSTFSREVVIKSQEKSRKDNGKQRQLWFAFGNTIGKLWPKNLDQECPLCCPCYNGLASAHSLNFTGFYDSITSDVRSLKTLDLFVFYMKSRQRSCWRSILVPILLLSNCLTWFMG